MQSDLLQQHFMLIDFSERKLAINALCATTVKQRAAHVQVQTSGFICPTSRIQTAQTHTLLENQFFFPECYPLTCPGILNFQSAATQNIKSHFSAQVRALESCPAFGTEEGAAPHVLLTLPPAQATCNLCGVQTEGTRSALQSQAGGEEASS